jgi:predicted N-acetyltransferase YhbS
MAIITLKQHPELLSETLNLIERSFHYEKSHSFREDFAPLMNESNFENIFLKLDDKKRVIAHLASKTKYLNHHPIIMLGGIAVDPQVRGEGHFQELMSHILVHKKDEGALFLLWSDQEKLYRKFGFYLCGQQFEHEEAPIHQKKFSKTKFSNLSGREKEEIKYLFNTSFQNCYLSFKREEADWQLLDQMNSSDLYLRKEDDIICDYFFMNKGQDLTGIIYEYGTKSEIIEFLKEISSFGKVWSSFPLDENDPLQFQFMACPGDKKLFTDFISELSMGKIKVHDINTIKQEVYFNFGEDLLALDIEELLKGLLGPGIFEELPDMKKIFISGLDSV